MAFPKPKMAKAKKGPSVKPRRPFGLRAAFGSATPKQAFGPQGDQAAGPGMAFPQAAGGVPAVPPPAPTVPPGE